MLQIYEFIVDHTAKGRSFYFFSACCSLQQAPLRKQMPQSPFKRKIYLSLKHFKEVEKQSGLSVGYNDSQLKNKPVLNLDLRAVTVENALTQILKDSGFTYEFKGKYIMIVPDKNRSKSN